MNLTTQEDLEPRIAVIRERIRVAPPGGAREVAALLAELDGLLERLQTRQAAIAAERKWLARSNAALEARLDRLEKSLVFRLLRPFQRRESKGSRPALPSPESVRLH